MSAYVLDGAQILVGGYDLSPFTGSIDDLGGTVDMKEANNFAAKGHRVMLPGLKSFTTAISGQADYGSAAAVSRAFPLATVGDQHVVSIVPTAEAAAGDVVHFTRSRRQSASVGAPVGEVAAFSMGFESDTAMVDGLLLDPLTSKTSSDAGDVTAMAGPAAGQYLYAGLHVAAVSGTSPTLDVKIQSAALVGFGSPTDRVTFSQVTDAGARTSQWATPVAGAITDGFWRVTYTLGGTDPDFAFAVVVGVLTVA